MSDMNNKDNESLGSLYMTGRMRAPEPPKRRLPTGMLTTAALLVFAAIIWYAYPRGAEKYSDTDVPVVKADSSPVKAEPVDPGGMEVRHQDSTVFDQLEKKSPDEVEKLLPAPEEPMDKEQAIKSVTAPKADMQAEKAVPAETPKAAEAAPPEKTAEKQAAAQATGNAYIQLGSYHDMTGAKKGWELAKKKYPDLLGNLAMKTEKADLAGKGIYYRLQAGAMPEARAREICAALKKAGSVGCIVVKEKK